MQSISGRDIVVVGLQSWDTPIGSNCKNIAIELAKNNRVLYVNYPIDTITKFRERKVPSIRRRIDIVKGKFPALEKVGDSIWNFSPTKSITSINWIKNTFLFDLFNKRNNKTFASEIQKTITDLGFKDIVLFNDSDMLRSFYMKELLKPDVFIYYSRDNLVAIDYWKRHGGRLEPQLIAKADVAIANSVYLAHHMQKYNPDAEYVGQGCDVSLFDEALIDDIPADIAKITKPIIGYVGALVDARLDIQLLIMLAKSRPDWSVVLVGPEDDAFKESELHQLPNVYFTGNKDGSELPAYIKGFDVCINPQIVNELTIGNYPRKIDEYLAMGKPVVATATEAMSVFADFTYLANTNEHYLSLIEKALAEHTAERAEARKVFAREHTWTNNVLAITKAIQKHYEKSN